MSVKASKLATPNKTKPLIIGIALASVALIVIAVIIFWTTTAQQPQQTAQESPQKDEAIVLEAAALDQIDMGNNEVAVKMLTEVINLAPRRSESYYNRAVAYSNLENYEDALADFGVAIEANPHWALPLAARASAHTARGTPGATSSD